MIFSFRGHASSLDTRAIARSDPSLMRLRRTLVDEMGVAASRADRLIDEMLLRALTRWGDDVVRGHSATLNRVVDLRERLDDLYDGVLAFNARTGTHAGKAPLNRSGLRDQLGEIETLIKDLDIELAKLRRPVESLLPDNTGMRDALADALDEVAGAGRTARRPGHEHRDVLADTVREAGRRRSRLARKGFRPHPSGQDRTFRRTFADGSTVDLTIEGGRYRVHTRDAAGVELHFNEYDVLLTPYARRPLTTSLMQAHHGLQNSLMTRLFREFGYNGEAAPTVWLRNSRRGSPHGSITAAQNAARSTRASSKTTLAEIRRLAIKDLRQTHMPDEAIARYVRAFDTYFERNVLPNMSSADRARLLGGWTPGAGL